jgi:AraC-like DNA-binding protein
VSSRESGRRIDARTYAPPDDLARVVMSLWVGQWDLRGQEPHVTELLADPCMNIVFESGDGEHAGARVVGVWTKLWRRELREVGRVIGVKLRAGAPRAVLPQPAHRLTDRITPLGEALDDTGALERAVLEAPEEEALATVVAWLREVVRHDDDVSLAVALVERVAADPELTTVEALVEAGGLGERALQRLFRNYVGASPKWVIRRNRLQEVALRIERGDAITLATLAAELGYTDQAHLARDFRNAVGKPPSAFAALVR